MLLYNFFLISSSAYILMKVFVAILTRYLTAASSFKKLIKLTVSTHVLNQSITKPILQQTAHKTLPQRTTEPLSRKSPGPIRNWRHWSMTGGTLVHCSCYWTPGGRTQEQLRICYEDIPPHLRNRHSNLSQLAHGLESVITENIDIIN